MNNWRWVKEIVDLHVVPKVYDMYPSAVKVWTSAIPGYDSIRLMVALQDSRMFYVTIPFPKEDATNDWGIAMRSQTLNHLQEIINRE